jgi:hypothetical protein
MRKLTVKNFSVIKDAELEFGKITVLIGPQASGKSLLCKLAYFLSKQTIEDALIAILSQNSVDLSPFDEFQASFRRNFLAWFPFETWQNKDALVAFESLAYRVQISATKQLDGLDILFSPEFETLFGDLADLVQRMPASGADSRRNLSDQVRAQFYLLLTNAFIYRPVYIPDGRAFFANQSLGFNLVNNPDIDPIIKEFSLEVSWGGARSPDPILGEDGLRILNEIRHEIVKVAGGYVEGRNGSARFRRALDGKSLPLPLLSSGTQAMLPMLNVLWQMITEQRGRILFPRPDNLPGMPNQIILSKGLVYLEEPEANIFPNTQYELIRLFAWLSNEWRLDFSWVITTHSPYILSAFGDLVKAGMVGARSTEHHTAVAKVIPEQYWIKEGDFAAYKIENGVLVSIFDKKTGQIDGDYLDDVSSDIAEEFGQLLEIQYGR